MAKGLARAGSIRSSVKIIASIPRGGRAFLVGNTPETSSNSSSNGASFQTDRGVEQSRYLNKIRGESQIPEPQPILQPLAESQVNAIAATKPRSIADFGTPLTPDLIGLPPRAEPGEESVKTDIQLTLFSFKQKVRTELVPVVEQGPFRISRLAISGDEGEKPEEGELVGKIEVSKKVIQPQIETPDRPVQQHTYVFAQIVRESLARLRSFKAQSLAVPATEVFENPQPQVSAGSTEVLASPKEISTPVKTAAEPPKKIINGVKTKQAEAFVMNNQADESVRRQYVAADEEINEERKRVLRGRLLRLRANSAADISGGSLVESSDIYSQYLKSRLLFQTGMKKELMGAL
jgi:hypothetical protein